MGFHTFEARFKLTKTQFNGLKNDLHSKGVEIYTDKMSCERHKPYIFKGLKDNGIIAILSKYEQDSYKHYVLKYRINPRRVIDENNYVGIFNSANVDVMMYQVNNALKSVSKLFPDISDCTIARIDYCANVKLDSAKDVELYLDLLKRCNIPDNFEIKKYYDKKAKKKIILQDGLILSRSNLVNITFYNKQRQMGKQDFNYPDCNNANGIIRFEIQCLKRKAFNLTKRTKSKDIAEFLNKSDKICDDVFTQYLPSLYGTGDFYTLERAMEIISHSNYSDKTKKKMIWLVNKASKYSNLNKAINEMHNFYDAKVERDLIKKFNKCNLSPLTIPRRWNIKHFSNPLTFAKESMVEEFTTCIADL